MGLFPSCHKAKETWFLTYSFFSTQKPCTSRPYCTLIFLGRTLWISNVSTFLSFVRGLHFLLCNKRPVCRKTDWVFISSSFFSKETVQKVWKASPISVSTLYPFCYKAGDTNCRVSLFWTCSSLTYIFTLCFTFLYDCFFLKKQFRKFSKSDTYLLLPYNLSVARVDTNYRV